MAPLFNKYTSSVDRAFGFGFISTMKKSICIVEDQDEIRFLLSRVLTKEGFTVEAYPDGYALFDREGEAPDLFILDIELPGVNGLEICRWIKSNDTKPVLLISGSPELEVLASNSTADAYMAKPLKTETLLETIHVLLAMDLSVTDR